MATTLPPGDLQERLSSRLRPVWRLLIYASLVLAVLIAVPADNMTRAVEEQASLEEFAAHLDERISVLMNYYDIPGVAIALVHKGETVLLKAYGYADLEAGKRMTTDAYFKVGSISKSVTSWGVMKLVEQGKIALDDPVVRHMATWELPESAFSAEKVTVRQLLSLSAGMPLGTMGLHYSPDEAIPSLRERLSREAILQQEPGSSFYYSNVSFNLLELLIEEVTGCDFAQYMQEEVLIPLGMHDSSFAWSEEFDPAVPFGYDLKGNPVPVYVYAEKASGGLFATVEDTATFIAAGMASFHHAGHEVLTSQSINELYTPVVEISGFYGLAFDSYGLGHFIENLLNGKQAVSHGGQGYGWMTHFHSVPETGDGIVILTNSQRSWPFFAHILSDWATWSGLPSVGMGRIIIGERALWVLIGLLLAMFLWQLWRLRQGVVSGRRRFAPLSNESRLWRLAQGAVAVVLALGLFWASNQDYLFVSAVFPIASSWLGISLLALAVGLLLSALLPYLEAS